MSIFLYYYYLEKKGGELRGKWVLGDYEHVTRISSLLISEILQVQGRY